MQVLNVQTGDGGSVRIAYDHAPVRHKAEPGMVWFPGFNSTIKAPR